MPRHALILYNPAAGTAVNPDLWLGVVVHKLAERYAVTAVSTTAEMRSDEIFQIISDPLDLIVAAGGDGTIRFALGAVAQRQSNIPVGIIPLGTGNQLARNLSIFQEHILWDPLQEALSVLVHGVPTAIDLGIMNGEYFCVAAGCGPFSDAIISPDQHDKGNWRMVAYASSMIQTLTLPPVVFHINIPGVEEFNVAASGIFVTNIADLGIGKLSGSAEPNDGLLDLCILNPSEFGDYMEMGFHFAGGFVGGKAPYYIRKVSALDIGVVPVRSRLSRLQHLGHRLRTFIEGAPQTRPAVKKEVNAMIDGDAWGTTPMHIEVVPSAVQVLVPKQAGLRSRAPYLVDKEEPRAAEPEQRRRQDEPQAAEPELNEPPGGA